MNLSIRGGQELQCTKNASIAKQLLKSYNLNSEDLKIQNRSYKSYCMYEFVKQKVQKMQEMIWSMSNIFKNVY